MLGRKKFAAKIEKGVLHSLPELALAINRCMAGCCTDLTGLLMMPPIVPPCQTDGTSSPEVAFPKAYAGEYLKILHIVRKCKIDGML